MWRVPVPLYMAVVFFALLLYGVFMLLPPRTKSKKKKKRKAAKVAEYVIAVVLGTAGLTLLTLAYPLGNPTAKAVFRILFYGMLAAGLLINIRSGIWYLKRKLWKRSKLSNKSMQLGALEVVYGVSTPQVFNGSEYKVAYQTMVQEAAIPFITCELHLKDDTYIGDIFFEAVSKPVSVKELQQLPIIDIHIEK